MQHRPPYQPWYEGDFWSLRVRGLHWLACLFYRAVLQGVWDLDPPGRLPNDDAVIRALAGAPADAWEEHRAAVLSMFDLSKDGSHYTNRRQMDELKKYRVAAKKRIARASKGGKAKAIKHLTSLGDSASSRRKQTASVLAPANQNQNQNQNQTITKEHKTISAETSSAPVIERLPLNDGSEYCVTQPEVDEWARLYPVAKVPQELRSMRGWLMANQQKRKTRTGIKKFINAWLARVQDKGSPSNLNLGVRPNGKSTAEQRVERNREKYARIEQTITGVPANTGTRLPLGVGGSGDSDVAGEPELLPDTRDPVSRGRSGTKPA